MGLRAWVSEKDGEEIGNVRLHLLAYILGYIEGYGYPPTVREIRDASGFSSTNTVQYHLDKLIEMELLMKVRGKARMLTVTDKTKKRVVLMWGDSDAR